MKKEQAAIKPNWETYEGETHGYLDDGREITITARTHYSRWGDRDSNIREWFVHDEDNQLIAKGKADGLRAAKAAALVALMDK